MKTGGGSKTIGEGRMSEKAKTIYVPELATVQDARMLNETEYFLRLEMDGQKLEYLPGQFLEMSMAGFGEAPISISSSPTQGDGFELVIRKVGNVTSAVHNLKVGEKVGIRGPYGNGIYPYKDVTGENLIFICGGIGLVPQRSFINYVLDNRADYGNLSILFGTKTYDQRFFLEELDKWRQRDDVELLETIDGEDERWKGDVGVVTNLIDKITMHLSSAKIFLCGPPVMYKFVLLALKEKKVKNENIYLNLERKMKCGVGKCGHCQMNDIYVCIDGPVFKYSVLENVPEAI